jgi:eukaryotic-like serine/threonine-protein kinase
VLAIGPDGKAYVLDYGNRQVQRLRPDGEYETRWAFRLGGDQPGMRLIDGFTVGDDGTLFISDGTSGKIRSVTPEGKLGPTFAFEKLQGEASDQLLDLGVDRAGRAVRRAARRPPHPPLRPRRVPARDGGDLRADRAHGRHVTGVAAGSGWPLSRTG